MNEIMEHQFYSFKILIIGKKHARYSLVFSLFAIAAAKMVWVGDIKFGYADVF